MKRESRKEKKEQNRGKRYRQFRYNNDGSAIVVVIIAMAMIGILVSAILWSAYMNYMIKISDMKNKKGFYSAETVMEQIVAGLQHEASAAITIGYQEVMQNWNPNGEQDKVETGENERSSRFAMAYLSILVNSLKADDSGSVPTLPGSPLAQNSYYYDRETLQGFIDEELFDRMDKEEWGVKDGTVTKNDNIMEIINNNSTLVLRNVRVSFTDEDGYVSIINTDICIDVPKLIFYQNPSIDSLYDYALIGNEGVETEKNSGKSVVHGGIYAGIKESGDSVTGGLTVNTGSELRVEDARYVISKGDISVEPTAAFIADSEVYADGLNVNSGTLRLDGKTYVADDLVLSGTGSKVTLEGEYYGYGTSLATVRPANENEEGQKTEIKAGPEASSAILINGINATLNMSNVTKMMLAGRAYVGQSLSEGDLTSQSASERLVMTGESITIKGNQIAYLVPAECIGTLDGKTMIGQNPLNGEMVNSLEAYKEEYGEEAFQEIDFTKPIYRMGNKTLMDYGVTDMSHIRKVYKQYNSADSANKTLLYYYLSMDADNAAEYFRQYYNFNANKNAIDSYFWKYVNGDQDNGGVILNYASSSTQYTILGNSIVSDTLQGSTKLSGDVLLLTDLQQPVPGEENGEEEEGTVGPDESGYSEISNNISEMQNAKGEEDVLDLAAQYADIYQSLTTNLTINSSGAAEGQNVFNSIILNELRNDLKAPEVHDGKIEVTVKSGTKEVKAVLTSKDYVVADSEVRLVVAISDDAGNGGNVTINKDFDGLIIAQGTITLGNDVEINKADIDNTRKELSALLNEPFPDNPTRTPISYFVNGGGTLSEGVTGSSQVDENGVLNVDLSEIVRYMNWIKK